MTQEKSKKPLNIAESAKHSAARAERVEKKQDPTIALDKDKRSRIHLIRTIATIECLRRSKGTETIEDFDAEGVIMWVDVWLSEIDDNIREMLQRGAL